MLPLLNEFSGYLQKKYYYIGAVFIIFFIDVRHENVQFRVCSEKYWFSTEVAFLKHNGHEHFQALYWLICRAEFTDTEN